MGKKGQPRAEGEWGKITEAKKIDAWWWQSQFSVAVQWDGGIHDTTTCRITAYCKADPHRLCLDNEREFKKSLKKIPVRLPVLIQFLRRIEICGVVYGDYHCPMDLLEGDRVQTSQNKSADWNHNAEDWGTIDKIQRNKHEDEVDV